MKTAVKKVDQPIPLIYTQEKKPSRDAWNKGKLLGQKPPLTRIFHEPSKDPAKWSDNIESDVIYRQMEVIGLH